MGCMYAEGSIEKCQCACKGSMHALMVPHLKAAKCSPAAEARCKAGQEDGECQCGCKGVNHGLYRGIENFETVRISGMKLVEL